MSGSKGSRGEAALSWLDIFAVSQPISVEMIQGSCHQDVHLGGAYRKVEEDDGESDERGDQHDRLSDPISQVIEGSDRS